MTAAAELKHRHAAHARAQVRVHACKREQAQQVQRAQLQPGRIL